MNGPARGLRACMVCSIVQQQQVSRFHVHQITKHTDNQQKFISMGCPNCEEFLNLRGSSDAVNDCCSQVFEGVITLVDPQVSWVAKWQRLNGYVPGTYAVKVTGIVSNRADKNYTTRTNNLRQLPEDIIQAVEDAGVKYIPRDGSQAEEEAV